MKKTFLFRLITLLLLCFVSVVIKSESSSCKIICNNVQKNESAVQSVISDSKTDNGDYKMEPFIIKI